MKIAPSVKSVFLLGVAGLNLTCDSPFEPVLIPAAFDISGFQRLSQSVPIPGDQLFLQLTRVSSGEVVFSQTLDPDTIEVQNNEAAVDIVITLNASTEDFALLAELRGGDVTFFRVDETITVTSGTINVTPPLVPVYVGPGANATEVRISLNDTTITGGDSILVSAQVFEGQTLVPDAPVVFYSPDSATVDPDGVGLNQAWIRAPGALTGSVTIVARAFTQSGFIESTGTLSFFARANQLVLVSGQDQLVPLGGLAPQPLVVRVLDAAGANYTRGYPIIFAVANAPAGTFISPNTTTTDQNGLAQTLLTGGGLAGPIQIIASATGLIGSPVTFNATASSATGPANVTVTTGNNQSAIVNTPVPVNPVVQVTNGSGGPEQGVDVEFTVTGGGGSLAGSTVTTDANGNAAAPAWTLGTVAGTNSLQATVVGVDSATITATGLPDAANVLAISSGDGQSADAGTLLSNILVVQARDQFGNGVNNVTIDWTTIHGTLNPTQGQTFGNGEAQTAWQLGTNAITQFATATATGLTPAVFTATAIFQNPTVLLSLPGSNRIAIGSSQVLDVTLTAPAPTGGVTVTVTSDNGSIIQIGSPGSAFIAEGTTTGQISVDGLAAGATTLRGNATGYTEGTLNVEVSVQVLSMPQTLNVAFGGSASLPLQISQPAPVGGTVVTLVSTNPATVAVTTPTVTILEGQTTANATVSGVFPGQATITGTTLDFGSAQTTASTTATLNLVQTNITINESFSSPVNVQLESGEIAIAAPVGGVVVTLTSDNPTCAVASSPVTIPAGLVDITSVISYGGTATTPCNATITASAPNITSDQIPVTVNPLPGITLGATTLAGGLQRSASGTLGATNHGGVTVTLASVNPALALLSTDASTVGQPSIQIPVLPLANFFTYFVHGLEGVADTGIVNADISVSAAGFQTQIVGHTIEQPGIVITGLAGTTTAFSADDPFVLSIGVPNIPQTGLSAELPIRAGGTSVTATVVSSDPAVGQLNFGGTIGGSVAVAFNPLESRQTISFDPLGAGATTVSATMPGFIATSPAQGIAVDVTAPGMTLTAINTGGGLSRATNGTLGASNHGGVTITLTSSDPAVGLLAPDANTAGQPSIQIPIADGSTFFQYWVHGLEGVADQGPVSFNVTADVPGFTSQVVAHTVEQPAVQISGLSTTSTTLSPNDAFNVTIGIPNVAQTALVAQLPVRPGGVTQNATVVSSDGQVANLVFAAQVGPSVNITFAPGESNQIVEFDPANAGPTTVSASITNYISTTSAQGTNVTVTAPVINLPATTTGGGLQRAANGTLGASNHGGVTVTLTSVNPALMLLSPDAVTPGTASIQIPVADATTFFQYYIQGLEGVADTGTVSVDVNATATGFVDQLTTHTVVQPAVLLSGIAATTTSLSLNDPFIASIGIPNAPLTSLAAELQVRAGGPTVAGTIVSSTPSVGQLVFNAQAGGSVNVTFAPGESRQTIDFDPVAAGVTTVAADVPGFLLTTPAQGTTVTVTSPGITLNTTTTGTDLQRLASGNLGAPNHSGVTVTLQSSSPSNLLIAPDAITPGTASLQIFVPNGQTFFSYYVQGIAAGTPTVNATANGFVDGVTNIDVVQPAVGLSGLLTTQTAGGAADAFIAFIGLPNAQATTIIAELQVRAGIADLMGTVNSVNPTVGDLTFDVQSGGSINLNFASGTSRQTVNFNPMTAGSTTVVFDLPGFVRTTSAAVAVTVN